jgi:hypothetical protein
VLPRKPEIAARRAFAVLPVPGAAAWLFVI